MFTSESSDDNRRREFENQDTPLISRFLYLYHVSFRSKPNWYNGRNERFLHPLVTKVKTWIYSWKAALLMNIVTLITARRITRKRILYCSS